METWIFRLLTAPVAATAQRWLAKQDNAQWRWETSPLPVSNKICIFVTYSPGGYVPARAIRHAEAWRDAGYLILFVIALDDFSVRPTVPFGHAISRENVGHDFAAWSRALCEIDVSQADFVATVNDSVYSSPALPDAIRRAETMQADVVGFSESREIRWHIQSYAIIFHKSCLPSTAFKRFWSPRTGSRRHVIWTYELQLGREMRDAGFRVAVLFPVAGPGNPITHRWPELLSAGFPYLKRSLLPKRRSEWLPLDLPH